MLWTRRILLVLMLCKLAQCNEVFVQTCSAMGTVRSLEVGSLGTIVFTLDNFGSYVVHQSPTSNSEKLVPFLLHSYTTKSRICIIEEIQQGQKLVVAARLEPTQIQAQSPVKTAPVKTAPQPTAVNRQPASPAPAQQKGLLKGFLK